MWIMAHNDSMSNEMTIWKAIWYNNIVFDDEKKEEILVSQQIIIKYINKIRFHNYTGHKGIL